MAKAKSTAFFCKECGYESSKWMGQCPACRQWNTMVEEPVGKRETAPGRAFGKRVGCPPRRWGTANACAS